MSKYKYVTDLNPFGFHEETIAIEDIIPHPENPRQIGARDKAELSVSLSKFGLIDKPIINPTDSFDGFKYITVAGHQRLDVYRARGLTECPCMVPEIQLTDEDVTELLLRHNRNTGDFDKDKLGLFDPAKLLNFGFALDEIPKVTLDDELDAPVTNPVFPITPRLSEKHDYVMIVCDNEIDLAWLHTRLNISKRLCYKTTRVGVGRVITVADFKEALDDNG